jgi:hypothetical protein
MNMLNSNSALDAGANPASQPASNFVPDDKEIFAASALVVGEDREAYKGLYIDTCSRIRPRDGYEKELLRQLVNNLWIARQFTRLGSASLYAVSVEMLGILMELSTYAKQHWADPKLRSKQLALRYAMKCPEVHEKINKILEPDAVSSDTAVLMSLLGETENYSGIQELVNRHVGYADQCLHRILAYRKRMAKLFLLEADG